MCYQPSVLGVLCSAQSQSGEFTVHVKRSHGLRDNQLKRELKINQRATQNYGGGALQLRLTRRHTFFGGGGDVDHFRLAAAEFGGCEV